MVGTKANHQIINFRVIQHLACSSHSDSWARAKNWPGKNRAKRGLPSFFSFVFLLHSPWIIELSLPTIWMPGTGYSTFGVGFPILGFRQTPKEEWLRSLLESHFLNKQKNKQNLAKNSDPNLLSRTVISLSRVFSVHTTKKWNQQSIFHYMLIFVLFECLLYLGTVWNGILNRRKLHNKR